ncbi:MAG: glycosyltransferase [Patescibacteria group bacterium]|uniref:Glycosyltransferase n=1 Tax=candidate division WWE3 bacterium TaxID=2053526 RepID=A0A955EDZ3_UNCKA|nr:glycosyltransferase [candidate division WWE3 bacterium]
MQKGNPRVAIVVDYLNQYGGAEKTLEAMCELFPEAPIYTSIYEPNQMSEIINSKEIITPDNTKGRLLAKLPKHFTFLMPSVFEAFDLSRFDLIISSGTAWSKSVLTTPDQLHISYIHTPPRFLYGYSVESVQRFKWYYKPFVAYIDHHLRVWDFMAAQRPNYFVANSEEIKERVFKFYKRKATVIYPPVEVEKGLSFKGTKDNISKPYYLVLGRLAAYKNVDLVIEAFNLMDLELKIIGTGKEETKLKRLAKSNVTMLGKLSETEKHKYIENCLGVIFPVKDEDFGIVPIEAFSHGKPVLAHKSGGPKGIIKEGFTGEFFTELTTEGIVEAVKIFDNKVRNNKYNPVEIKNYARQFSKDIFKEKFTDFVNKCWSKHLESKNA